MANRPPHSPVTDETYETGNSNRRRVLGDAYVDRAWQSVQNDDFMRPLQECVTGLAWGGIWGRPGLESKIRSVVTVSCLLAMGRRHELALHLRGAINNGWTKEELQEIIIHAGCYCGWPVAVDGFRVAKEVLDAIAAEAS